MPAGVNLAKAPKRSPREVAPKGRISAQLRKAVQLLIWKGYSRSDAAEEAGLTEDGLYRALRRPHVQALLREEYEALRDGSVQRAFARQEQLAEAGASDQVKERANRWIAGVGGLAPVKNVNINAQVAHSYGGYSYDQDAAITIGDDVEDADIIDE